MKLTQKQLKQLIKEELESITESDPYALKAPEETIGEITSMMQGMKQTELDDIYRFVLKKKNQKKSKYRDLSPEEAAHNQKLLKKDDGSFKRAIKQTKEDEKWAPLIAQHRMFEGSP